MPSQGRYQVKRGLCPDLAQQGIRSTGGILRITSLTDVEDSWSDGSNSIKLRFFLDSSILASEEDLLWRRFLSVSLPSPNDEMDILRSNQLDKDDKVSRGEMGGSWPKLGIKTGALLRPPSNFY